MTGEATAFPERRENYCQTRRGLFWGMSPADWETYERVRHDGRCDRWDEEWQQIIYEWNEEVKHIDQNTIVINLQNNEEGKKKNWTGAKYKAFDFCAYRPNCTLS